MLFPGRRNTPWSYGATDERPVASIIARTMPNLNLSRAHDSFHFGSPHVSDDQLRELTANERPQRHNHVRHHCLCDVRARYVAIVVDWSALGVTHSDHFRFPSFEAREESRSCERSLPGNDPPSSQSSTAATKSRLVMT